MVEFTPLCLTLVGMIFIVQGQRFTISTKFMNGNLIFTWTKTSTIHSHIQITKDSQSPAWKLVDDDNQYTVEDVMQYKSVTIMVRKYNTSDIRKGHVDYRKTYHIRTLVCKEGESINISWTAEYFPRSGSYSIFHAYIGPPSKIITVAQSRSTNSEKYVYHTRPYDSVNISFEVRNITVKDAGYYTGSPTETYFWFEERGVILTVLGKPEKPIIRGDLDVKERSYAYLKCESKSTSAPNYYKKFPQLSYSWFVNNTRLEGEDRETYRFNVSKNVKYNNYSCQAKETLDSKRSEQIRINPLFKSIESNKGESKNISWTAKYFPKIGKYYIFHFGSSVSAIIQIIDTVPPPTEKYVYYTRPFNSTNIQFEVKNITAEDAGYYVGNPTNANAWHGERGVVLIVFGKPMKPIITGDFNIKVKFYTYLKCESKSTSAPDYYKDFPPLSYSWFVNNTRLDREDRETYSFVVSKEVKYNRYSCQAKETLESERSGEILINPLYGPESVKISPHPPYNSLSIRDGKQFGSHNCTADCNPPCTVQWRYKNPSGGFREASSIANSSITLPERRADRSTMALIRCVVNGIEGHKISDIKLNIQYLSDPKVYLNGEPQNKLTINEKNSLVLSCFVEGNPTPDVTLRKLHSNMFIGKDQLNYTLVRKAQCSDTSTYICEGNSSKIGSRNQSFNINVLCDPRLDNSTTFKTTYGSMSGPDVKVVLSLPVIANPLTSTSGITWSGPTSHHIFSKVSQRDNIIYKHWINSTITIPDQKYFGKYSLKYNGKVIVNITIKAEDKPQPPLNFSWYSYASGYINLTWVSNFNGGPEQFFILSRKKGVTWTFLKNLTDPGEGNIAYYDLGSLATGQEYMYRLESCNRISCSLSPVEVKFIVQALPTSSSIFKNPTMLIVIGSSVVVLVFVVILIVVITMFFRKKKSVPQKRNSDERSAPEQNNTQAEAVEYAAVDKSLLMKNRQQADVIESDVIKEKNNEDETTYSEVIKNLNKPNQRDGKKEKKNGEKKELQEKTKETGASNNDQETMYSEVIKSSNMPKLTDEKKEKKKKNGEKELQGRKEKAGSSSGNEETRTLNQDGLVYIDVEFAKKPSSSDTKGKQVIHGEEERTEYTFVDFSKKAPPIQETQDGVK